MAPHSQTDYIEKSFVAIPELIERQANRHGHLMTKAATIQVVIRVFDRNMQIGSH